MEENKNRVQERLTDKLETPTQALAVDKNKHTHVVATEIIKS